MAGLFVPIAPGLFVARGSESGLGTVGFQILGAPTAGRIRRMFSARTAGTGAAMDPYISGDDGEVIVQAIPSAERVAPETALLVDEGGSEAFYSLDPSSGGALVYNPGFDAGTDNVITYEIFLEQWR